MARVVLKKGNFITSSKEDKNGIYLVLIPLMTITTQREVAFQHLPPSASNTYDVPGEPILFGKVRKVKKVAELENSRASIINWLAIGFEPQPSHYTSNAYCICVRLCISLHYFTYYSQLTLRKQYTYVYFTTVRMDVLDYQGTRLHSYCS